MPGQARALLAALAEKKRVSAYSRANLAVVEEYRRLAFQTASHVLRDLWSGNAPGKNCLPKIGQAITTTGNWKRKLTEDAAGVLADAERISASDLRMAITPTK